jgi:probable phosphoglycerate mutase
MTDILLIRHTTTDYVNTKLAGRIDSPLNEIGRQRAQELAVALSEQPIAAVYSSPLLRTMETAEPLADRLHLNLKVEPGVIQVDYGDWESRPFWELEQDPTWRKFITSPEGQIPGGENVNQVIDRSSAALLTIADRHEKDEMVAVVTHGSIIRFVVGYFLGMPSGNSNRLKVYPGSVTVLRTGGPLAVLVSLNRLFLG